MTAKNLIAAVERGDVGKVSALLKQGADPNEMSIDGWWSPLLSAAFKGKTEIVKLLLENGADPNQPDMMGNTPLLKAITRCRKDIVKLLVKHGADVNIKNKHGMSAVISAARVEDLTLIKFLVDNGGDITTSNNRGSNALTLAIIKSDQNMIDYLLSHGEKSKKLVNMRDDGNHSSLHFAVWQGRKDSVEKLLKMGAEINACNSRCETALMHAVSQNEKPIVRLFLEHKPNIKIRNKDGNTALALAVMGGEDKIYVIKQLLHYDICNYPESESCLNIKNDSGQTVFDIAKESGNKKLIKLLEDWQEKYKTLRAEFIKAQKQEKFRKQAEIRNKLRQRLKNNRKK